MSLNNTNPVEADVIFGLINDIEKYIGQNLTTTVTDKLAKAFNKIYAASGNEVPREVIEFAIRKRPGEKWSLEVAKNDAAEVVCDIYETDKHGAKFLHQERAAVLKPETEAFDPETLPLLTLHEISNAVTQRHTAHWLCNASSPDKMLSNAIKDGTAGSDLDLSSPVYTYDPDTNIITVSYSHIPAIQGNPKDLYRLNTELRATPTLVDYAKIGIEVTPEQRAKIGSVPEYANNITGLFSLLSNYFPITVETALKSLKELVDNNKSSDGSFQLQGYSIPVLHCEGPGYWSANFAKVVLSKELVEEIILFNTELPLSTKGEIIEDIVGPSPEPAFLLEVTDAVNQVFHSTRADTGSITMRYSKTTGNVIIKERKNNENITRLARVNEKSIEIGIQPTLQNYLTGPDINAASWAEREKVASYTILSNKATLHHECMGHDVGYIQPFVDLMSMNTVTVNQAVFKVMPFYYPTVRVCSLKGTHFYLLTKDLIEELYELQRNPQMETTNETLEKDPQAPFPVEDVIGTFVLKASYYLSIDPYLFMNVMRLSNITPGSVKNAQGLDFVFSWDPETNMLRINRNEDCVLKQEFPIGAWDAFVAAGFTTGYHQAQHQKVNNMSGQASEGFIKEAIKARRIQTLIEKLKKTKGPEEAYDLIAEFLGDEYEQEGAITYKGVRIKYFVGYTTHNNELLLSIEVNDKRDRNEDPIFLLKTRVKRENIHRVYDSIKHLVKMHG